MNMAQPHCQQYAAKSLLANVLDGMRVHAASAKSDFQALTEIGGKMRFRHRVPGSQAAQVVFIKRVEVHWLFRPVYFSSGVGLSFSLSIHSMEKRLNDRQVALPGFSSAAFNERAFHLLGAPMGPLNFIQSAKRQV